MSRYVYTISDELAKQRLIGRLQKSPPRDERGRRLIVIVQRVKPRRSLAQNALFHAWLQILADHVGCTVGEMKRDIKRELLTPVETVNRITGEVTLEVPSTSSLAKEQMTEFMQRIEVLAQQHFGITLPRPDEPEAWAAHRHATAA